MLPSSTVYSLTLSLAAAAGVCSLTVLSCANSHHLRKFLAVLSVWLIKEAASFNEILPELEWFCIYKVNDLHVFFLTKILANVIAEMNRWDLQNKTPASGTCRLCVLVCATGCRQSQVILAGPRRKQRSGPL